LQRVNNSTSRAKLSIMPFEILHQTHFSKERHKNISPRGDILSQLKPVSEHSGQCNSQVLGMPCSDELSVQPNAIAAAFGDFGWNHSTVRKRPKEHQTSAYADIY